VIANIFVDIGILRESLFLETDRNSGKCLWNHWSPSCHCECNFRNQVG